MTLEDGMRAIAKPDDGLKSRSSAREETFVYGLDRTLDFQIVPTTAMRADVELPLATGAKVLDMASMQVFVANAVPRRVDFRTAPYDDDRLYALDYLVKQIDRNGGNVLRTPTRSSIGIDNSMIEGFYVANIIIEQLALLRVQHPSQIARPVSEAVRRALERVVGGGQIRWLINQTRSDASAYAVESRAQELIRLSTSASSSGSPPIPRSCLAFRAG